MNLPRHLLAVFFTTIILVGCDTNESSQLKEATYETASQPNPAEKAEVIGDTLGIAEPKPATDSEGQELLGVSSEPLLYSDAGLIVSLQGEVTVADGAQISKTLWHQVSGPAAQILNATQQQAQVIIPRVTKITDLEFAFAAADTSSRVAEARTRIRVSPVEFSGAIAQSASTVSAGLITITLSLPEPPDAAVTLQYRTRDGSALAGRDYESAQGHVTLTQEIPDATIEITALNSGVASGDLYFILNYSVEPNGSGSNLYIALPGEREGVEPAEPVDPQEPPILSSSSSSGSGNSNSSSSSSASSSTSSSSSSSSSGLSLVIPTNQNRKIATGPSHAVAIKADGTVLAWGRNEYRQCQVPENLVNVVSVSAGYYHNLALTVDGAVFAWGADDSSLLSPSINRGQLDVPSDLNAVAIAAGPRYSMALRGDGTVAAWGDSPVVPIELENVVAIAAGAKHSLALKANGTVVAWGDDRAKQSTVPQGLTNVVAIAAAGDKSFALTTNGKVIGWGDISSTVDLPENATSISAGLSHLTYITPTAEVKTLSTPSKSSFSSCIKCLPAPEINGPVELAAGHNFNIALKEDGSIQAWGHDEDGQLGSMAQIPDVTNLSTIGELGLAVTALGTVKGFGMEAGDLFNIPPHIHNVKKIVIGAEGRYEPSTWFALALDKEGRIYTWGAGAHSITLPENNGHIVDIAANESGVAIALDDNGVAQPLKSSFIEFDDSSRRLENIAKINSRSVLYTNGEAFTCVPLWQNGKPTGVWSKTLFAREVNSIASTSHTIGDCVINIEDEVECYSDGDIAFAFSDISSSIDAPRDIACGQLHCIVLQRDGSILAWGDRFNTYVGVLDVPPKLSMVTFISADIAKNYAVVNGRLVAWGSIYVPEGLHELFAPNGTHLPEN